MTALNEIDVSVLRLRPGDVLVARLPAETADQEGALNLCEELAAGLKESLAQAGHENVGLVILADGVEVTFEVVRPERTTKAIGSSGG